MLSKVVLHKRNGHRHPGGTKSSSLGEMLRLVHSVREPAPQPTVELVKFANVVRTEKATALLDQTAREIDALQLALADVLAQTHEVFARGELADVRVTLEAFRAQADLAAHMMGKLVAAAETRAPERRLVNLNDLVTRTLELTRPRLAGVSVDSHRDPRLSWIVGNARQLQQALVTLLGYAGQASLGDGRPGTVVVDTSREHAVLSGEDIVCIRITNDGLGLPPEALSVLTRSASAPAALPEGPDLDLYLAAQIVAEHGGVLSGENLPEGGARFIVELPAV